MYIIANEDLSTVGKPPLSHDPNLLECVIGHVFYRFDCPCDRAFRLHREAACIWKEP